MATDEKDIAILKIIQEELPVSATPYADIGNTLGLSEAEVISRLCALKANGVIRRMGAVIDSRKVDYFSTLCACEVAESRIDEIAEIINAEPGVTHNYVRDNKRNIWFTLTGKSIEEVNSKIRGIADLTGVIIDSMPAMRLYKINVSFEMSDNNGL